MADISKIQLSDNTQYNLKDATARNALSENDTSTGDISKIQLSDNTQYNIKDAQARQDIETITTDVKAQVNVDKDLINDGTAFIDDETLDDYDDKIEEMQEAYKKFIPLQTASGTEIQLDNSNNDKVLVDIGLEGNTEQTTYTGKNLLNVDAPFPQTGGGITISKETDGKVKISGTCTSNTSLFLTTSQNIVLEAGTYTLSRGNTITSVYLIPGYKSGTFTLSETTTFNQVYIAIQDRIGQTIDDSFYPMLVKSSTLGDYEPYTGRNSFT